MEKTDIPTPGEVLSHSKSLPLAEKVGYITDLAERKWPIETTLVIHGESKRVFDNIYDEVADKSEDSKDNLLRKLWGAINLTGRIISNFDQDYLDKIIFEYQLKINHINSNYRHFKD